MDEEVPVDDSIGPRSLEIVTVIFALGILLFLLRIYTRVVPTYKLNTSDYMIMIAVAEIITYSLFAAAVANGFGRHNYFITPAAGTRILKLLFGVVFTGLWVSTFARLSIAYLLYSFTPSTAWRTVLWFVIGFQVATLLTSEIFQLLECRPVSAMWEPVLDAKCMAREDTWVIGYVFSATSMFSDLTLTIIPMFLIWSLSRHILERFLIAVLMGLGLFATIATVMKVVHMKTSDFSSPDTFRAAMPIFLWCRIEECLIVAAASAPLLKAPIERGLHRLGFPTFQNSARELDSLDSVRTTPKGPFVRFARA
ncbi:hypothetical protein NCS52_00288700 [Fusarium sp. LHS14.1]|nr:hypothetical protein NCS52_00288700 [Fusarium sp. LHS14.1]